MFKRRVYGGQQRTDRRTLRLVGGRDVQSGRYWFYLTNIPTEHLGAKSAVQLYVCRWHAELVFEELKSRYRLDQLTIRKEPEVEALILSSIIILLVSRRPLDTLRRRLRADAHRIREGRRDALFPAVANSPIDSDLLPYRTAILLAKRPEPMLLREAIDPNVSRLSLLQRVDNGLAWAA